MSRSEADDWLTDARADRINHSRERAGMLPLDKAMLAMMISRLDVEGERELRERFEE